MSENKKFLDIIKKLLDAEIGDQARLHTINDSLQKGRIKMIKKLNSESKEFKTIIIQ